MRASVLLGLRLALGSAREQRVRAVSVVTAVAIGTVVLLTTVAIAHSERVQQPWNYDSVDNRRLLAVVVTAILVPVLVLVATVGRLSVGLRERRMANLRLLGLGSGRVRLVAAVEAGAGAAAGALMGIPLFWLLRPLVAQVHVAGHHWPTATLAPQGWAYPVIVLLLPGVVIGLAALPARLRPGAALALARRAETRRPHAWRAVPVLVGAVLCVCVISTIDPEHGQPDVLIAMMFVGITLLGVGLILLVPVFVRLCADLMLRVGRGPSVRVAARRLQVQPAGVNRVISGLLLGLFVVVGARAVVVAFESMDEYQNAAAQVDTGQTVVFEIDARHAERQARLAGRTPGVREVRTVPVLHTSCRGDDMCLTALVARCAWLEKLAPEVPCAAGRPTVLSTEMVGHRTALRLHGRGPDARRAAVTVDLGRQPAPPPGATRQVEEALRGQVAVDVVVPPSAPGVRPLLDRAHRMIVVSAPPGRWLGPRLHAHGVFADGGVDFEYYDYVGRLRALVWAVAAVILSIGLLSFAVAAVDRAVTRRREVATLQVIGVPRSLVRRTQWIESALPLVLGGVLAVGLGLLGGATFLSIGSDSLAPPWGQALVLAGLVAAGALVVGGLTVLASNPRLTPDLIRQE